MRTAYHAWLTALDHTVVDLSGQVARALTWATEAVLTEDLNRAESAIGALPDIIASAEHIGEEAASLMARQQPVAHDLRRLLGAQRAATSLQGMGMAAANVGKVTRRRYPAVVAPSEVRGVLADMAVLAHRLTAMVQQALISLHVAHLNLATDLLHDIHQLHREMLAIVRSPAWPHDVATAVDMTMLSRDLLEVAEGGLDVIAVVRYVQTGTSDPGFRAG